MNDDRSNESDPDIRPEYELSQLRPVPDRWSARYGRARQTGALGEPITVELTHAEAEAILEASRLVERFPKDATAMLGDEATVQAVLTAREKLGVALRRGDRGRSNEKRGGTT